MPMSARRRSVPIPRRPIRRFGRGSPSESR
jgi:hypothetical protein